MKYYVQIKNNTVLSYSNLPVIDEDIINQEIKEDTYNEYILHNNYYYVKDNELVRKTDSEIKKEEEEQERKRIQSLTCTKRVLVLMLEELGYDYFEQIQPLIELNRKAKLEWELCSELLRSNPLLNIIGEQLLLSPKQIDRLFKYANGEVDTIKEVNNG